jgi:glycosyltransferase involved in cell wall biosynthesis
LAGLSLDRFLVVPVGADEEIFDPARRAPTACNESGPLRVLFYGTYSPLHGAETIVEAVHRLEQQGEQVALVMIGTGQCEAVARRRAGELGLAQVTFIPWVPEAELPGWIAWADIVLGIFGATAKAARVVPNKVYQAMAMGATMVTRDSPALRWLAAGEPCAVLVPPGDSEALAGAIRSLRSRDVRDRIGRTARRVFEQRASTRARARALRPLFDRIERQQRSTRRHVP